MRILLSCAAVLFGFLVLCYSPSVAAQYVDSASAQSACNSWSASRGYGACVYKPKPQANINYNAWCSVWAGVNQSCFIFSGDGPPSNPCTSIVPANIYNEGKILTGSSLCQRSPVQGTSGYVQCAVTFTPKSPPAQNQYSGAWETYGTLAASGNLCAGQEGDPWKDGNGGAMNPAPPVPTLPAADVPVPPKMCGGGSCYDPKTDQYCGVTGGQQFCISGAAARSSAGGCVSSGDATICAGSPNAPAPPAPPASPITNPLAQIKSQDNTTQADPVTGTPQNVSTVVYAQPSANVQSGQQSGDSGPAPASSSGSPGVTASGGGDCNTPPIITGSPALAQVAFQTWKTRCAIEGAQGGVAGGVGSLYTKSTDTVGSVVGEFRASVADTPIGTTAANFFSVGSVGGACPVWTLPANDYLPAMTFDFYCAPELADLLDMARIVLLIGFAFVAWRIAMGDS